MSGQVHAPQLDLGLGWLNTDRPLRLDHELRGRVVVLDFWTYCCINCIHILPDLAYLEHKYRDEPVTFIGVHSAKFPNEASRETIRQAILRYEIKHPVVIDDQMKIWRSYAVRSWPTQVVIDPEGRTLVAVGGEGNRDQIDRTIAQALEQGRSAGTLAAEPLIVRREAIVPAASGLAYPGKVLADEATRHLFVADSNHNRIVVAAFPNQFGSAKVLKVVGSGEIGSDDGPPDQATFNHPQGLAVGHGKLYVADTENHLIRAIDLASYEVTTIVGTGQMTYDFAGGAMGTAQGINSPWDLAREGSTLYVAMAGTHQIWRIDLPVGFARALAGSGRENIVDGPTETSAFAQPSGICALEGRLYVADSEVSAIRGIDMATERVFTVVGEGLFSFGDVDGVYPQARLQHPLGVAPWGSLLLVADTYNHKIKLVDPAARSARTVYGIGRPATESPDGRAAFFEPGGLSVAGDDLFVADTNNHRVVHVNLITHEWREIALEGMSATSLTQPLQARTELSPAVDIAPRRVIELVLNPKLPTDAHLNAEAPWSIRVTANGAILSQKTGKADGFPLVIKVPAREAATDGEWQVDAAFASCTNLDRGACIPHRCSLRVPIRFRGTNVKVTLRPVV